MNYLTSVAPFNKHPTPSWELEILDTYYNGTLTLTLTPPPSNATSTSNCPTLHPPSLQNTFLRIGPSSRNNVSRPDKNPYYFHLGRTLPDQACPMTPNKAFVNFESSNDNTENTQVWTLNPPKKDGANKFLLDGSLTSTKASYNNYWNFVVNTTGFDAGYPRAGCPTKFSMRTMLASAMAKMNATVTAGSADLSLSFVDPKTNWSVTGSFSGKHWDQGAKIVFGRDDIMTEGQAAGHVQPRKPKDKRLWMDKYGKYVYIGIAVVVLLGICYVLWHCCGALVACLMCCFPCCSPKKRAEKKQKKMLRGHAKGNVEYAPPYETVNPQMMYKQASDTVTTLIPHDPRDSQTNYAVSPVVMQSYYIRGGAFLTEIAEAQMGLHGAHKEIANSTSRGDNDGATRARGMVGHYTGVVEHYMGLRGPGT